MTRDQKIERYRREQAELEALAKECSPLTLAELAMLATAKKEFAVMSIFIPELIDSNHTS